MANNRLSYAPDTWSGELPAEWIVPGLTLSVRQGNLTGELTDIPVGAPGELLLHTIDIGMLVEPRDRFRLPRILTRSANTSRPFQHVAWWSTSMHRCTYRK
ncbi:M66 family metalloprotease [Plesiomonas shigelloides subsp. oncorhynchi]|nr:M66 family metalloprotease [Plesiomonas shigelloides]